MIQVKIYSIKSYTYSIISPFCLQLGEHCSELKDIHLGQCYGLSDEGMVALARGCPKLQRVYLQENKLVSPAPLVSHSVLCFFSLPASGLLLVQEPKRLCVCVWQVCIHLI